MRHTLRSLVRRAIALVLVSASNLLAQATAPNPPADAAAVRAQWNAHLAENKRKVQAGEVGSVRVAVPRSGAKDRRPLRIQVHEVVPDVVRQDWQLRIVETHHFVAVGQSQGPEYLVTGVPTGCTLEVVVTPTDESAPGGRVQFPGPRKRGEVLDVAAKLAKPYPVLECTILDRKGQPLPNRDVTIEFRSPNFVHHVGTKTDFRGRIRTPIRRARSEGGDTDVEITPTALIRKGTWKLWTTEMPKGPRARTKVRWPLAATTQLGKLRLER